jgi:hypothetical protein
MERNFGFLVLCVALASPCSAFLPQSNLRSQPKLTDLEWLAVDVETPSMAVPPPAGGATTVVSSAALGLAAMGLAAAAMAKRASHRPAPRIQLRVHDGSGLEETDGNVWAGSGLGAGICFPVTAKFDPLNLGSTDAKMERYTNVEIKHGRIAMIATIGYIIPGAFHWPGCENFQNGLGAFSTIPLEGWIQLIAFIGAHEILVKPREGGMGDYDLGLGTELLVEQEPLEIERRQTVERNNGRLAMVAFMGQVVQDGIFGKDPMTMLATEGWWGPGVDRWVQYIPANQVSGGLFAVKPKGRTSGLTAMRATTRRWRQVLLGEEAKMSESVPFLEHPYQLDGWVGGEKGFDPLSVTDALPVYFVREAELKHCRVCMLATLGWIATDLGIRFPAEMFQNVSTIDAHDAMVDKQVMQPFLCTIAILECYAFWLAKNGYEESVGGTGVVREAGDFFLGKSFLPKDPEANAQMRLKELENGRLAMLAFSGICTAAVLTNKPWPFI